jgi:hypothetical protein
MSEKIEVHVRHPLQQFPWDKSPRFVSREAAETMVREGRAVYPGDPKVPPLHEDGKKP